MATNIQRDETMDTYLISVAVDDPATPVAGDPVRLGEMTGIAIIDEGTDVTGETSVNFGPYQATHSVEGVDGGGASAVAVGDRLYYTDADSPPINKKNTGRFYGFALETVGSGATATILVLHPAPSGA